MEGGCGWNMVGSRERGVVRTLGSGQSQEATGGRGKVMSLDFILSAKKILWRSLNSECYVL